MFSHFGINLYRKTLCYWALLASDWLAIIYREIQYKHWRRTYRQLDETPSTISNPVTARQNQNRLSVGLQHSGQQCPLPLA